MSEDTLVIANPAAQHGALGRTLPAWRKRMDAALPGCRFVLTSGRGDAGLLARRALDEGRRLIVVAGGNGTANEVADALLATGARADDLPEIGLVPVGVGVDLARSLGLSRNPDAIIAKLADPTSARLVDAGRVVHDDGGGRPAIRHFLNAASAGISAGIASSVNGARRSRLVPGPALFFLKTVQALLRHRFGEIVVTVDGAVVNDGGTAMVAVANGRFLGGGMAIAPEAVMDDGLFDVVIIRGASKLYMLDNMNKIYSGAHRNLPEVVMLKGRDVRIESTDAIAFEADGETPGQAPLHVEILPGALRVRA